MLVHFSQISNCTSALLDLHHLGVVIGHETAQLLQGHFGRHGRDERFLDQVVGLLRSRLGRVGFAAAGLGGGAAAQLDTGCGRSSLAINSPRSARRSMVSGVSPGWISVTPKLAVIGACCSFSAGAFAPAALRICSARRVAAALSQSAIA